MLSTDADGGIRDKALGTLKSLSPDQLRAVFAERATPIPVLEFAATQLAPERRELAEAILENPSLPRDLRESIENLLARWTEEEAAAAPARPEEESAEPEERLRETLIQKVNRMSAAEKIKAALTGSQEERVLLIRDANKIVARTVLQSPKLSDQEIEAYASMKNVSEEILRLIGINRKFLKSYSIVQTLVNNPRTPIDVSLPILNRLNERDLKGLAINKNVPEVIRSLAQKMVRQREEATKVKLPGKH
jgi:hypothetical protein